MKIAFIVLGTENLGVQYLSSRLKKEGHETKLIFDPGLFHKSNSILKDIFSHRKKVIKEIKRFRPDLIGFSVVTSTYQWACEIAKEVKAISNAPIIFGGYHASVVSEEVIKNDFVDMICVGEGEEALSELTNSMDKARSSYDIRNIWFKDNGRIIRNPVRPLIQDLDRLPHPDKSLYNDFPFIPTKYMISISRGCPLNCTFCGNSFLHKLYKGDRILRKRSIEDVLDELKKSKALYKYKIVIFVDDCFGFDRKMIMEFLKRYKNEINVPFFCNPHISYLDEELIYLLKEAGCFLIEIGFSTTVEEYRRNILNRPETNAQMELVLRTCRKAGLKVQIDHMFGLPLEGEKEQQLAVDFYNKTRPDVISCFQLTYYPGTKILETAKEKGWVTEDEVKNIKEGKIADYGDHRQSDIIKNRNQERTLMHKNFIVLFKLLPLLPQRVIRYITVKRLYRFFNFMPRHFIDLLKIINMIKRRDHLLFAHYKYYFYQVARKTLFQK